MSLPVADAWFESRQVDENLTLITETHVDPLLQANIWHLRGRDRDLVIDSGLGIASLRAARPELFRREPVLVVTHAHLDHMGSAYEFEECWAHPLEPVENPPPGALDGDRLATELRLDEALPPLLISARPEVGYEPAGYRLRPGRVTRQLADGDVIDLGDRRFSVLHLPGHTPGSIALLDRDDGTLFSGDVVYDAPRLDQTAGASIGDYVRSMRRLRELPVSVAHAGHDASFGRDRLHQIIDCYLTSRSGDLAERSGAAPAPVRPRRRSGRASCPGDIAN